jgi:hypothetical protein
MEKDSRCAMPSLAHEIAVARLAEDPALLALLAKKLLDRTLSGRRQAVSSTVQLANPEEVRPDILLADGATGPWDAVEVQRRIDRAKMRRWAILLSVLHGQRGVMGDLWVITAAPGVARWAKRGCDQRGPHGTVLRVAPTVLLLDGGHGGALLDRAHPELAFFAAWAMAGRRGTAALEMVDRALGLTRRLPADLRRRQARDILSVLDARLVAALKERWRMDTTVTRESRAVREWRLELEAIGEARGEAKGEARGRQAALLAVLAARGFKLAPAERARIRACDDVALLDRWISRAVTARSVEHALSTGARSRRAPRAAARASAKRRPSSR